jgi:putative ATPase
LSDLFGHHRETTLAKVAPLADRLRPKTLDDFVGQEGILGEGRLLRRAIAADRVGNLILHGPPGVGKTTLARIIAGSTRAHFSSLNAVLAGVKDLRLAVDAARERLERHGLRTTLFIDEVHRFNSAQQDALLPWVENGTVTLIGATTENPFFEVNKALVSRSRLFRLQPLERPHLQRLLERALRDPTVGYGDRSVSISPEAADHLLDVAGGDARSLLNALELAVETTPPDANGQIAIDLAIAEESIQQRAVLYDKQGDAHFDTISAFIKSLRGSDPDAALFWLARMVEAGENPRFIFRRMLISAGEDIGLADPEAIVVVEACAAAFERVGLPEGLYPLAQAALYLAGAEKSNSLLGFFDALKTVKAANNQQVPAHLRDANRDGKAFGDGVGYRYPHAYAEHWVAQQYLPSSLQGEVFWQPGRLGWEGALRTRLQQRRAAQLAAAAETAADQSHVLSSSPDDPQLERWLQRQASAEGERLDQLRQRLWEGARWQRHDRVLVVEAHSLLWALDPLEAVPEGEVVITVPDGNDQERLRAQLQLLDSLRQPRVVVCPPDQPASLHQQLEPGASAIADGTAKQPKATQPRFEWIAARQPWRGLDASTCEAWLEALQGLICPQGQWRLLFSTPEIGPAAGLLAAQQGKRAPSATPGNPLHTLLVAIAATEAQLLSQAKANQALVDSWLRNQGWSVNQTSWQEPLQLELTPPRIGRWLGAGSDYRDQLEAMGHPPLTATELQLLHQGFAQHLGQTIPQQLQHTLVMAKG